MAYDLESLLKWQLWFHYVPLLAIMYYAVQVWEIVSLPLSWHPPWEIPLKLLWFYLWLAIGDQIIHLILNTITDWED